MSRTIRSRSCAQVCCRSRSGSWPSIDVRHAPESGPTAVETRLDATPAAASAARRFITETLVRWQAETAVDDAVLCGSELVTNAVLHAGGSLVVRLSRRDGEILLEVIDEVPVRRSTVRPRVSPHDNTTMTGRGLAVLATLATTWGVDRLDVPGTGEGKVVWARLPVTAVADRDVDVDLTNGGTKPARRRRSSRREAELIDVPVRMFLDSEAYLDDVLRELQLAWWAHPDDGALGLVAARLGGLLARTGPSRATSAALARARLASGHDRVNLLVAVDRATVEDTEQFLWIMDEVEAMAASGRLLVPPLPPGANDFRRWFAGELARQFAGELPLPCPYA